MKHRLRHKYGKARRRAKAPSDAWRHTPEGHVKYFEVRAKAQKLANELGFDHCIEANDLFKEFSVKMLPGKQYRSGHELRCEVVMPERLEWAQPGHGPMARG